MKKLIILLTMFSVMLIAKDAKTLGYMPQPIIKKENLNKKVKPSVKDSIPVKATEEKDGHASQQTLKITAVGDIMLGTTYPEGYLHPNPENLMKPAIKVLKLGDVVFGNLEGPLADTAPLHKRCKNPKSCYAFKSPTKYIKHYVDAGFNFLSLANNHSGDFGVEGRNETKKALEKAGIAYSGILGEGSGIKTINGKKIGMLAFAPNWGTNSINNIKKAVKMVKVLDKKVDIIIVSFHGGAEGRKKTHVYKKGSEMFLGENRGDLVKFSKAVINAGADIVIGHGPHVPRAVDIYKKRLIIYSLGNFATYGRFSLRGISGYAPIVFAELNDKGEFVSGKIHSFKQVGRGGVVLDKKNKSAKLIKKLSKEDFPKSKLKISNTGVITIK